MPRKVCFKMSQTKCLTWAMNLCLDFLTTNRVTLAFKELLRVITSVAEITKEVPWVILTMHPPWDNPGAMLARLASNQMAELNQ